MDIKSLTKKLIDDGKIIESGWTAFRVMVVPENAPKGQLDEMRMAFFAGAQHLYGSMMSSLDPGREPTEDDMRRMGKIHDELEAFIAEYKKRHGLK